MIAFTAPIPGTLHRILTKHRRHNPVCSVQQDPHPSKPAPLLQNVAERLKQELPSLFSSAPDYSIYAPDVTFEDPLTKFRGIAKYASNINFLNNSPVFSSANLTLHDTAIITNDTVRTRWTLSMIVNLPWLPCVAFTGQSDYVVDLSTGKVIRHYDYWDSLNDSTFFSFSAVSDLLAQCRAHLGPRDLGGFDLLRRTDHFQIRRFDKSVVLRRVPHSEIEVWEPTEEGEGEHLSYAAVIVLSHAPKNDKDVLDHSNELRRLLEQKSYAAVAENYYYVCPRLRGQIFHEIWLELSDATVFVDT